MADGIDRIVTQTIAHTLTFLTTSERRWDVAREGIDRIHDDLAERAPSHPALERLRRFVARRDRHARAQ